MDQEFILKAILIISISLSILIFTFFMVRLLTSLQKLVDKTAEVIDDTSEVTGTIADSFKNIKKSMKTGNIIATAASFLLNLGILSQIKHWLKKKNESDDVEPGEAEKEGK